MTGVYPVQMYLHRIGKATTPYCPHCANDTVETLTHFACICPKFREARTAAHNQLRSNIAVNLKNSLPDDWVLLEETPLTATGLQLQSVSAATFVPARSDPAHHRRIRPLQHPTADGSGAMGATGMRGRAVHFVGAGEQHGEGGVR